MTALLSRSNLTSLRHEMDRLFDRVWDGGMALATTEEFTPTLDVFEGKDTVTLKVELPGLEPKDVHVRFQDGVLMIQGEKKQEVEKKDERFYRMERTYGAFARSIRLPVPVDGTRIEATFRNGVLTVVVPKAPEARSTEIPVKVN